MSDLFVAQMIGHSTPSILQKYSKAIDEYRRDAVRKLEQMRTAHVIEQCAIHWHSLVPNIPSG